MGGYIAHFSVYTMAMIGLICFAVFVYKKITDGSMRSDNTKFLNVEESMSLSPRKTLHVVRAGNEKFLIASDVDRTTLISKLEGDKTSDLKNLERFRQIPEIFSEEKEEEISKSFGEIQREEKPYIHLEPINPEHKRQTKRGIMNKRANTDAVYPQKTVVLDFDKPKNHGFSTMKEMAKRINEL